MVNKLAFIVAFFVLFLGIFFIYFYDNDSSNSPTGEVSLSTSKTATGITSAATSNKYQTSKAIQTSKYFRYYSKNILKSKPSFKITRQGVYSLQDYWEQVIINYLCKAAKNNYIKKIDLQQNKGVHKECIDLDGSFFENPKDKYGAATVALSYDDETGQCSVKKDTCKSPILLYEAACVTADLSDCIDGKDCSKKHANYFDIGELIYEQGIGKITNASKTVDCTIVLNNTDAVCVKGACKVNTCGDGVKTAKEECDDGNKKNGDGCSNKCAKETQPPKIDLYVGKIYEKAISNKCNNYYAFQVCNKGISPANTDFTIAVTANNISVEVPYKIVEKGIIESNKCVEFIEPQKLHILAFTVPLQKEMSVLVKLDSKDAIAEINETNNSKEQKIYSGDNYMFDSATVCDNYCYDNDGGKNYLKYGEIIAKYKENLLEVNDFCDDQHTMLGENFCKKVYKLPGTNLLSNPLGFKSVDCRLIGNGSKCFEGKCISSENKLECIGKQYDEKDVWTKGSIEYTDIDGEGPIVFEDFCKSDLTVVEYYCKSDQELMSRDEINCLNLDAICKDGKCVNVDKVTCKDSDSLDYYNPGYVIQTAYLNDGTTTTKIALDTCFNYADSVTEVYCNGTQIAFNQYKCTSESENASCKYSLPKDLPESVITVDISGSCVKGNKDLMLCSETDNGLDYYKKGDIAYTTEFNEKGSNSDYCDNDNLIEFYCKNKELTMADPYPCPVEGKSCYKGACLPKGLGQKKCLKYDSSTGLKYNDKGIDYYTAGYVEYTNEFGDTENKWDYCDDGNLIEGYCEGTDIKSAEPYNCAAEGKICYSSKCAKAIDKNKVYCAEGNGIVSGIDIIGQKYVVLSYCDGTILHSPSCNKDYLPNLYDILTWAIIDCTDSGKICKETKDSKGNWVGACVDK